MPCPGVMEPSELEVDLEPGVTLAPSFLMGRLRPTEVEQHDYGHSASLVELGLLVHRAVLILRFGPGSGFSSPIKVAGGLLAPHGCPGSKAAGSTGLPSRESVPPLLVLWDGTFLAIQACPRSPAASPPPLLPAPRLPLTLLPPGLPFGSGGGHLPPRAGSLNIQKLPRGRQLLWLGQEGVKQFCLLGLDTQLVSWPPRPTRPSGLTEATPPCSICPKAKSPGGGRLLPLWACRGGRALGCLSPGSRACWERAYHWAGCPGVSQRQEEGDPELPGVVRASSCRWVQRGARTGPGSCSDSVQAAGTCTQDFSWLCLRAAAHKQIYPVNTS